MTPRKRNILFLITSDPRTSHRPAEAVRIGAGVAVGQGVQVHLCFAGLGSVCLTKEAEDFPNGGDYASYLSLIREEGGKIYFLLNSTAESPGPVRPEAGLDSGLTERDFADLTANSDCLLHF